MFKRLFWLVTGAAFGFGTSFWLVRWIRETAARYTPERVSSDLAGAIRGFGQDVKAAVAEGRAAMEEREAELRGETRRLTVVRGRYETDDDEPVEAPPRRRTPLRAAAEAPTPGPTGKLAKQLAERLSR